jgi:hypothetical protein
VKQPLAVVTMVYNEPDFLPVWARHYAEAVGESHCYVIDHGSDDGSVAACGFQHVAELPRSALDETWRAALVSHFCGDLLARYDAVAYTDVDELLVADPRYFSDLAAFADASDIDVLTAFGTNMLEVAGEAPLELARPISAQRRWTRPFSSLCKPVLTRRAIQWSPGFHTADAASRFGGLYLFHIAYADHRITARRQAKRRGVARSEGHGVHHGVAPDEMVRLMTACAALPRDPHAQLGGAAQTRFTDEVLRDGRPAYGGRIIATDRETPMLWAMPPWLEGAF